MPKLFVTFCFLAASFLLGCMSIPNEFYLGCTGCPNEDGEVFRDLRLPCILQNLKCKCQNVIDGACRHASLTMQDYVYCKVGGKIRCSSSAYQSGPLLTYVLLCGLNEGDSQKYLSDWTKKCESKGCRYTQAVSIDGTYKLPFYDAAGWIYNAMYKYNGQPIEYEQNEPMRRIDRSRLCNVWAGGANGGMYVWEHTCADASQCKKMQRKKWRQRAHA